MRLLLAVTGGIAAYKAPELVRLLTADGHQVRCILSANARHLVAPATLTTLCGHPVEDQLWPADGHIPHIELARWCEGLLVAPATANVLAKFALGLADDLLSTCYLALEPNRPVWLAPAMNTVMWGKRPVQANLQRLRDDGLHVLGPVAGNLACGEDGIGAMLAPTEIQAALRAWPPRAG